MYSQIQINLYLLYFYIWALVQLWIGSRVEESFPPILCKPWLGGNSIYGALSALDKTVSAHNPQPQHNRLMLSERVLDRWWRLVAFMKATNLLHHSMRAVLYRRIAMAIETASKVGSFCIVVPSAVALAAAGAIRSE
jgi:hypothetical protein